MKLHTLKPAAGSTHSSRRIGRGPGSGLGGTSTRGHKGAKSRSGYKRKIGFEGGQMPLQRRVPKSGFKNINHKEYFAVKATPTPAILKILHEEGCGTDCSSMAELVISEKSGITGYDAQHPELLLTSHKASEGTINWMNYLSKKDKE